MPGSTILSLAAALGVLSNVLLDVAVALWVLSSVPLVFAALVQGALVPEAPVDLALLILTSTLIRLSYYYHVIVCIIIIISIISIITIMSILSIIMSIIGCVRLFGVI